MIVGDAIADFCQQEAGDVTVSTAVVREFVERERSRLGQLTGGSGGENAEALREAMTDVMTGKVGIFRDGSELAEAVERLEGLLKRSRAIRVRSPSLGANPELVTAYRTQRMLKVALTVACGALARTESRGAHFRNDFPRRDDSRWLSRTLATWPREDDTLPTLSYETLDVMKMELPPGWRGYGARDYLDHPDTARRLAEVEALRARFGNDRAGLQAALLPYRHLLPPRLRGDNVRLPSRTGGAA
jgi:fumarate reductase flavoprotein subunit